MKTAQNIVGAVLASFALMFVMAAGMAGQLFTISGDVNRPPSYGTAALPVFPATGYVDPLTYDEKGQVVDFTRYTKDPGTAAPETAATNEDAVCQDTVFEYDMQNVRFWKRGFSRDATQPVLEQEIAQVLEACLPSLKNQKSLSCASSCSVNEADVQVSPIMIDMESANYFAPGALQFVFVVNASCVRTQHCQ